MAVEKSIIQGKSLATQRVVSKVTARLCRLGKKLLPKTVIKGWYRKCALSYISSLKFDVDLNKKSILVLNHFYDQDIKALQQANTNYNIIPVATHVLFKGAKIFFRNDIQGLNAPYANEDQRNIEEYRNECRLIFNALKQRFGIKLIVTPSDNYYWVRELIMVARDQGVKTVVLDKEGLISPNDFDAESMRIKRNAPFMSDHIYVWSERQRTYWEKSSVDSSRITVIGQARSDLFHGEIKFLLDNYFNETKPLITFFTYEDNAYIPLDYTGERAFTWKKMKEETQDLLAEISDACPEYNFVFKAHPQQSDLTYLQQRYDRPNLKVLGGSHLSNELIMRSELIIAFQTTAVLEAMFMNKPVIYTAWSEMIERVREKILPYDRMPGLVVAENPKKFRDVCSRFVAGDHSDFEFPEAVEVEKHKAVSEYFYRPDGHVCDRFFSDITRFLL